MRPFFAPYLLPVPESAEFGAWQQVNDDDLEPEPLEQVIHGWAPGTSLRLRRSVHVDLRSLLTSAGLPEDTPLWVNVSWIGSRSKLREPLVRHRAQPGLNVIDANLPGERIGGTVTIRTTIVLAQQGDRIPGVAVRPGSVLLFDEASIVLEGDSSSFPTSVVDFGATSHDLQASWHLTTSTDLEASFGGRFLLEINDRDSALVKALESEKPTPIQRALINAMMSGVGEILLDLAYRMEDENELRGREFEDGTVGAVLSGLLSRAGSDRPAAADDVASLADRRCTLQGTVRRLGFGDDL